MEDRKNRPKEQNSFRSYLGLSWVGSALPGTQLTEPTIAEIFFKKSKMYD
jgi:hypothetical protein